MKGKDMDSRTFQIRLQKWAIFVMLTATALAIGLIVALEVFPLERSQQQSEAGSSSLVGKQAPDLTLTTLDGTEVASRYFAASGVFILIIGVMLLTNTMSRVAIWTFQNGLFIDFSTYTAEPTYITAVLAGLLSFLSSCVLPLVPAYLGYLSGHAIQRI